MSPHPSGSQKLRNFWVPDLLVGFPSSRIHWCCEGVVTSSLDFPVQYKAMTKNVNWSRVTLPTLQH